jgi:hypothetical protein
MIAESDADLMRLRLASIEEADVVVVGGGSAGVMAAYAAARTGARTILIESASFLGGTTTGGLVSGMQGWRVMRYPDQAEQYTQVKRDQVVGGFAVEFIERVKAAGGAWGDPGVITTAIPTDPEIVKIVMEQMLSEAGVDVWFLTQFVDTMMAGKRVTGVVVASEGALHLLRCKTCVDASGDGDVAARAGADFQFGRPSDGKPQAASLVYTLGGVNFEVFIRYLKDNPTEVVRKEKRIDFKQTRTPEMMEQYYRSGRPISFGGLGQAMARAAANGDYPLQLGAKHPHLHLSIQPTIKRGKAQYSVTKHGGDMVFGLDSTDRRQMTAALMAARTFALRMSKFYQKYVPGFEDSYLLDTATMLGVRESRRIIGDYMLTEDDARECRTFDDAIGINGCRLDVHVEDEDSPGVASDIGPKGWYQIPYRVLLPKGIEALLVAGRCLSADHVAQASLRIQATGCMVTGHAAGTAAAMAAKEGKTPRQLNLKDLQGLLRGQGALIDAPLPAAAAM